MRIQAFAEGPALRAARAAAEQLSVHLGDGAGQGWPVELQTADGPPSAAPSAAILFLLPEVARADEPIERTRSRWRARLARLLAPGRHHSVFIATVFKCVHDRRIVPFLPERIRRLNLMAVALSAETGVNVIEIDRILSLVGARTLGCDYRMDSVTGAEVAGHAIVSALLAAGLEPLVPAEVERAARVRHGGPHHLAGLVTRRLAALEATGAEP